MNHHDYDTKRFLSSCAPKTAKALKEAWAEGAQLASSAIPRDALPAVLILAGWGRRIDIEIVDDYDELLERTKEAMKGDGIHHPDLFFASSIIILAERGQEPSIGAFETINVPTIYEEFFGDPDGNE